MVDSVKPRVAIVDIGIGNLMSIEQAFLHATCDCIVTRDHKKIMDADAVVLPGVGAFGDAMKALNKYDLVSPLKEIACSSKYLIGICLGMQLLFTESNEFGASKGLNVIEGEVVKFPRGNTKGILKLAFGTNSSRDKGFRHPDQIGVKLSFDSFHKLLK